MSDAFVFSDLCDVMGHFSFMNEWFFFGCISFVCFFCVSELLCVCLSALCLSGCVLLCLSVLCVYMCRLWAALCVSLCVFVRFVVRVWHACVRTCAYEHVCTCVRACIIVTWVCVVHVYIAIYT